MNEQVTDDAAKRQVTQFCVSILTTAPDVRRAYLDSEDNVRAQIGTAVKNETADDWNDYSACFNPVKTVINLNHI